MFERLKWLILAITLLASMFIVSSSSRRPPGSSISSLVLEIVGPVENILSISARRVGDFWANYLALVNTRQENKILLDLINQQERALLEVGEFKAANERLSALLGLREAYPDLEMKAAHVLGWEPGPWFRAVIINLGARDGVAVGQPVIHNRGVVGRVVVVSPNYARVLLANDSNSSIDSFFQRTRAVGILKGQNARPMAMEYVRKDEDVRPGDLVVTSGLDGYFPRGLPLGAVSRVNRQNAYIFMEVDVTPHVSFDRLEEVLVVLNQGPPVDWLSLAPRLKVLLEDAEEARRRAEEAE